MGCSPLVASVDSLICSRQVDGQFVPSRYGDRRELGRRPCRSGSPRLAGGVRRHRGRRRVAGDARIDAAWLDVRADAAWWLGRMDDCIASREAAYAIYEATGDERRAGPVRRLALRALRVQGAARRSRARGCAVGVSGSTARPSASSTATSSSARSRSCTGGASSRRRSSTSTARSSSRSGCAAPTSQAEAQQALGRVLIDRGNARDGLEQLDEAMLLAVEGRLSPYSTGKVYCSLISACEQVGDYRRAAEWTEATSRWTEGHPHTVFFPGVCRVHHAWALQSRGDWTRAEQEVMRACAELRDMSPIHAAAGYVELGELRRRFGDLAGAEDAFREAEALSVVRSRVSRSSGWRRGRRPRPRRSSRQALDAEPWNRLARARLLPARVQIAVACGEFDAANEAVDRAGDDRSRLREPGPPCRSRVRSRTSCARAPAIPVRRAPSSGAHSSDGRTSTCRTRSRTARLLLARRAASPATKTAPSPHSPPRRRSSIISAPSLDTRFIDDLRNPSALPDGLTEPRGRGAAPRRLGPVEQGHRSDALVERAHRRPPPVEHLHEDRRRLSLRGHRLRLRARPALT